jgi:RND superfamily putative drug exporter
VTLSRKLGAAVAGLPAGRRTKWLILVVWLALAAGAVPLAGKVSQVATDSSTVELPRGAESTEVTGLADQFPDGTVAPGIVVYVRDGGLAAADWAKVEADRRTFAGLAAGPVAAPAPSADGAALTLTVPLARNDTRQTLSKQATRVRDIAGSGLPDGLTARLTGPAGSSLDASDARRHTAAVATLITVLVVTAVLLLTYRSPVLWLLPLVCVGAALVVTDAVTYLLGLYAGMTVDAGNAVVVTVLVFGVGTDYALLLIARYRDELRHATDRHVAMAVALRRAVPAITASAATVSLGLLCLLAAHMGFNYTLGSAGAIGVLCGLAAMTVLLPALLVVLGRWVFWPRIPRPEPGAPVRSRGWATVGRVVASRPRLVWLAGVVVLGVLGLGAADIRTGLDDRHLVVGTPDSVAGQQLIAAHYPAGVSRPVQVVASAPAAPAVATALRTVPGVAQVRPPVTSSDGTLVRFDAVLGDPVDSPAAAATVQRIGAAVHGVPGAHALVGGYTAVNLAKTDAQRHDRLVVIPLVLLVVFTILVVLLRAVVAPLLLMATVVLSFGAALGVSALVFEHVFGFAGAEASFPLLAFVFLVALGIDYNIFLITRVREETARYGTRQAALSGLAVTGGVITSAGLVLAATFAVLATLPLTVATELGFAIAFGILLDTTVVRSVLVTALTLDIGRHMWWPSRLSRPTGHEAAC